MPFLWPSPRLAPTHAPVAKQILAWQTLWRGATPTREQVLLSRSSLIGTYTSPWEQQIAADLDCPYHLSEEKDLLEGLSTTTEVLAGRLGLPEPRAAARLQQLRRLLPRIDGWLVELQLDSEAEQVTHHLLPKLEQLTFNVASVADMLLHLRLLFPTADVQTMVFRAPDLLSMGRSRRHIAAAAGDLRRLLSLEAHGSEPIRGGTWPFSDFDSLVEAFPWFLDVEGLQQALSAAQQLGAIPDDCDTSTAVRQLACQPQLVLDLLVLRRPPLSQALCLRYEQPQPVGAEDELLTAV